MVQVDYVLGIDEVTALSLHFNRTSPTLRRRHLLFRLLVPGALLIVWFLLAGLWADPARAMLSGVFVAAFSIIYFAIYPSRVRQGTIRLIRRLYDEGGNRGAFGWRRMTITPETITEAGELTVTTKKWAAVDRIEEDDRHAFFYVSSMSAFVLPKSAFPDPAAYREFVETARRFHREAPVA